MASLASLFPRRTAVLFGVPGLGVPSDCARLARRTAARCDALAAAVISAHRSGGPAAPRRIVRGLDALSSTVCGLVDPLELARSAHPEEEMVRAADAAHGELCETLHRLNTSAELHAAAAAAARGASALSTGGGCDRGCGESDPGCGADEAPLCEAEARLARAFVSEFEQEREGPPGAPLRRGGVVGG